MRPIICMLFAAAILAGCGAQETESAPPSVVIAKDDSYGPRDRDYGLTESADGELRVFAAQRGDYTDLMIMRRDGDGWTTPVSLEAPRREHAITPHISRVDGRLYFATDAPHPGRDGGTDHNIWSAEIGDGNTLSDLQVMSDDINTGAHEESPAFAADGTLYFSSDHPRHGGGFDIYAAQPNGSGGWDIENLPINTRMADAHIAVTPQGDRLFYYAHLPEVIGIVDIFTSARTGDGWSVPVNLGPYINTTGIDYGAGLSADGERFFFSRDGELMEAATKHVLDNIPASEEASG